MISQFNDVLTSVSVEWYHESDRHSNCLLITVGDSWTWGDSLGNTQACSGHDDRQYRLSHVYGTLVAQALGIDHINIGLPGLSNFDMWQRFTRVYHGLQKDYDKIYVIFTLTEIGRDHGGGFLQQELNWNAIRGPSWPEWIDIVHGRFDLNDLRFCRQELQETGDDVLAHLDLFLLCRSNHTVDQLLESTDSYVVNLIMKTLDSIDVCWALGHAFTSPTDSIRMPPHKNIGRWTDIIATQGSLEPYPKVFMLSQAGIKPLMDLADHLCIEDRKSQWMPYLTQSTQALNWLDRSPYNSKVATRHPLEQAHKWWADHIKDWIHAQ